MKFTGAIAVSLLATSAAAFDKYLRTTPSYTTYLKSITNNNPGAI